MTVAMMDLIKICIKIILTKNQLFHHLNQKSKNFYRVSKQIIQIPERKEKPN